MLRSEERWRSVFENSAVGVALTDLNGRFIATNPVYQRMLAYTELELQSLTFLDITHEQDRDDNTRFDYGIALGGPPEFQIEKQYRRKDGTSVWARNNVSIVPGTEWVPRCLMTLSEDITQRKLSESGSRQSEIGTCKCVENYEPGRADGRYRARSQPAALGDRYQCQHLLADAFR